MDLTVDKDLATGPLSLGQRPGLLIIDMSLGFTSPESPLGGDFESVKMANLALLKQFRAKQLPIFFTTVVYPDDSVAKVFRQRIPDLNILQKGSHWVEIDPYLKPQAGEYIIEKGWPSGFFKTNLLEKLKSENVDSLVITGLTTSGCVRATVVDALQNDYPSFVPEQACGDRNLSAHQANLHDINAKYGQVIELNRLINILQ
jgi:maleamate amidohydrolase